MRKATKLATAAILTAALAFSLSACDGTKTPEAAYEPPPEAFPNYRERPELPTGMEPVIVMLGKQNLTDSQLRDMVARGEIPMDATVIGLGDNKLTDISVLREFKELRSVNILGNDVEDISVLAELPHLVAINVGGNKIKDITPLANLEHLMELHIMNNEISDISVLKTMNSLSYVNVFGNPITAAQINEVDDALTTTDVFPIRANRR